MGSVGGEGGAGGVWHVVHCHVWVYGWNFEMLVHFLCDHLWQVLQRYDV